MAASKSDLPALVTTDTRPSVPMHEIEPSPVDDESFSKSDPEKASPSRTNTSFLGLRALSLAQQWSTLGPAAYLSIHYVNTAIIPLLTQDAREADKYLLLTRPFYQSFPLEQLLIFAPILTHVISGVALRIYRRRVNATRYGADTHEQRRTIPWPKLSLTSALGYALYPMFVGHVLAMRIIPKKIEGSSAGVGLRYFAHGIARDPIVGNIGYATFVSVASFHFVTGAAKFLKLSREYITEGGEAGAAKKKWRGRIINGIAATVAAVWISGALGIVARSAGDAAPWEASNWDKIYRAIPIAGAMY